MKFNPLVLNRSFPIFRSWGSIWLWEMLSLLRLSSTLEFLLFLEWLYLLFSYSVHLLLLRLREIHLLLICTSILTTRLWDMLMLLLLFLSFLFLNSLVLLELYLEMVLSRWRDSTHWFNGWLIIVIRDTSRILSISKWLVTRRLLMMFQQMLNLW